MSVTSVLTFERGNAKGQPNTNDHCCCEQVMDWETQHTIRTKPGTFRVRDAKRLEQDQTLLVPMKSARCIKKSAQMSSVHLFSSIQNNMEVN